MFMVDGGKTALAGERHGDGAQLHLDGSRETVMVEGRLPTGPRVLVYDEDAYHMGSSVSQKLALDGYQVTLASPAEQIGSYMFYADEGSLMHRALLKLGVSLRPSTVLSWLEPGVAHTCHPYDEKTLGEIEFDSVILVTRRSSNDSLYRELMSDPTRLDAHGIRSVFKIGDAVEPRLIADAIFDGHRLAREIDQADPATPLAFIRENRVLGRSDAQYDEVLQIQPRPSSIRST